MTEDQIAAALSACDEDADRLAQLISEDKSPHTQAVMAKTKPPNDSPSMLAAEQMIAAMFPPTGSPDLLKALEIGAKALPQGIAAQAFLVGASLAAAAARGTGKPSEAESFLQSLFNMPVSAEGFKALRTKLRITQEELGAAAGLGYGAVSEWERGRNPLPQRAFDALLSIMMSRMAEPAPLTGNDIVKLRKNLGISQARLAETVGVSTVSIASWEKFGDRPLTRASSAKVRERYADELAKAA